MTKFTHLNLAQATAVAVLVLVVALTACGGTIPSRFYVLSPMPPANTPESGNSTGQRQGVIVVGPIEMPKYLDRAQIVTFIDPSQLEIAEFDRWAEPLSNSFARVMAESILLMTSAARVEIYPFPVALRNPSNRQIVVQVIRFHQRSDGMIDLWANWNILDQDGRRNLAGGTSKTTESATAGDFKSVAAAMSRAVSSFSNDLAKALNALPSPTS